MSVSDFNSKLGGVKRNSNIELLRIIAMFMVLMLHVNVFSIGLPNHEDFNANPLSSITRIFFQSFAEIAVDLFVLISGWFGIKYTTRGLLRFLYQSFFIVVCMTIVGYIFTAPIVMTDIVKQCLFFSKLWFIVAYGGLYIIAPILNSFIENSTEKKFRLTLIAFFLYQCYFSTICPAGDTQFATGTSIVSFMGLYLLAKYIRLYGQFVKCALMIWGVTIVLMMGIFLIEILGFNVPMLLDFVYNNNSPVIIISALSLLTWVASLKPRFNNIINFVAASAFSVYLLHMGTAWTMSMYKKISIHLFNNFSGLEYLLLITAFMVGIYILALLLDQFRKLTWDGIVFLLNKI